MKKFLSLLILLSCVCALAPQDLDYVRVSFNISVNASSEIYVPISDYYQTTAQNSSYGVSAMQGVGHYLTPGDISYSAIVETNASTIQIIDRGSMPIADLSKYLASTQNITANNPVIISKALELAYNVSGDLDAIAKIVEWTHNHLEYEEGANPWAPAVYDNRKADCRGYATLAASLFRSVNVPAIYVEGYAYNGIEFVESAWLEVFALNNLIPVDPCLGEMWLDAGHIKLTYSDDPANSPELYTEYTEIGLLNYSTHSTMDLNVSVYPKPQGFGRSIIVEASAFNNLLYNIFPSLTLNLGDNFTAELETRVIVLPPNYTGSVFWEITHVVPEAIPEDEFTETITLSGQSIEPRQIGIDIQPGIPLPVKEIMGTLLPVSVDGNQVTLTVEIQNTGDLGLENIVVTISSEELGSQSQTAHSLDLAEKKTLYFFYTPSKSGTYIFTIFATSEDTFVTYDNSSATAYVELPAEQASFWGSTSNVFILVVVIILCFIGIFFLLKRR